MGFPSLSSIWTQMFPPKPSFTEKDLPDLSGKVYIVTGANTGLGKELARMLFAKNARVYVAARNGEKAARAIEAIQKAAPDSAGSLVFLSVNLADLTTVKPAVERFLAAEKRLDVLFNNAGYMGPDGKMMRTPQGHEMHIGVNCLGAFLLTRLLTPVLLSTAAIPGTSAGAVRVVCLSSFAAELFAERDTAVDVNNLDYKVRRNAKYRYGASKAGSYLYAVELSRRHRDDGLVGLAVNPGNLKSELFRRQNLLFRLLTQPTLYPVVNGAYTELFAGLSPEVASEKAGSYVAPFGRFHHIRADLEAGVRPESEGGKDSAKRFWEWSEEQVKPYL